MTTRKERHTHGGMFIVDSARNYVTNAGWTDRMGIGPPLVKQLLAYIDDDLPEIETGVPQIIPDFTPIPFQLTDEDIRCLFRQTFHTYITQEDGTSGPGLHRLLERLRAHVGPDRYAAFVAPSPPREWRGPGARVVPPHTPHNSPAGRVV